MKMVSLSTLDNILQYLTPFDLFMKHINKFRIFFQCFERRSQGCGQAIKITQEKKLFERNEVKIKI